VETCVANRKASELASIFIGIGAAFDALIDQVGLPEIIVEVAGVPAEIANEIAHLCSSIYDG
jgi:hypothetical protein